MTVADIMERDLSSISEDMTLLEAMALLSSHSTSGLPVLDDDGRVVGFLSQKDILKATIPGYVGYMDEGFAMPSVDKIKARVRTIGRDPVRDHMSADPVVFDESEELMSALVAIFKKNVRIAPVVRDGLLTGRVERDGLLRGFIRLNFAPGEIEIPAGDVARSKG